MTPKLLNWYKKLLRITKPTGDSIFLIVKIIVIDVLWKTIKSTLIVALPLTSLYALYRLTVENSQVESLGIYVLTPLAVLIALSSLLYSRARAVDVENHATCLLAAERVFLATIYYSIAILWGFVIATFNLMLNHEGSNLSLEVLTLIYSPSFLFAGFAYIDVFKTLSQIFKELKSK